MATMSDSPVFKSTAPEKNEILAGSYAWPVEDFLDDWTHLVSPVFSVGPQAEMKLSLHLFKFGVHGKICTSVYTSVEDIAIDQPTVTLKHGFCIINSKGEEVCTWIQQQNTTLLEKKNTMHISILSNGWASGNPRSTILSKQFTLIYEIHLHKITPKSAVPAESETAPEILGRTISDDLEFLFNSQKGSDVILLVESQEFRAHKVILSARSSVFATMFEVKMEENQVKIEDIDVDTFKQFLRFIYTDEVEDLEKHAYKLLRAAYKYNISRLKSVCEVHLCRNLDIENCSMILAAAETYKCDQLKEHTLRFIVDNSTAVMNTEGFTMMAKRYPLLVVEAFQAVATKAKEK